jgi:tripartite-type tricarboxylate transporter receptor subunit TctC
MFGNLKKNTSKLNEGESMKLNQNMIKFIMLGMMVFTLGMQHSDAQTYPIKPIRLIIPFVPAGITDTSGRYIAEQLTQKLGQSVVVENHPGASGNIGTALVAQADPDGYTLLLAFDGTMVINPNVFSKVGFDTMKDFSPVGKIGDAILILVANTNFPGKTLSEVIAISKKEPNGLSYGTSGTGGTPHIAGELLKQRTGANLTHIPYKGGGQAIIDVLGGTIPLVYTAVAGANQYVNAGKLNAIAVSSAKRAPSMPTVPTFMESGIDNFEVSSWVGILAPAKTPKAIIEKLNKSLNEILSTPEAKERLNNMGVLATPDTPERFGSQLKTDLARYKVIVKTANIKVD